MKGSYRHLLDLTSMVCEWQLLYFPLSFNLALRQSTDFFVGSTNGNRSWQ